MYRPGFTVMNVRGLPLVVPAVFETFKYRFIFGGRFQIPCAHHRKIVEALSELGKDIDGICWQTEVIIWPIGRYGKQEIAVPAEHRKELVQLAFGDIRRVDFRFDDLNNGGHGYTPTVTQYDVLTNDTRQDLRGPLKARNNVPAWPRQAFIVAGSDNVKRAIVDTWEESEWLWNEAPWLIVTRPGHPVVEAPKNHTVLELDLNGAATDVVEMIRNRTRGWERLVANDKVAVYIRKHNLCL